MSLLATTTTRTWEPAWHRRARSQRAQARTLLRLGKAAELLQAHHSAQRDMSTKTGREPAVLPGPRKPIWGCSCGHADNWACRVRCQRCDKAAPQRFSDAARAAAKTWQAHGPARTRTNAKGQSRRPGLTSSSASYADMAKRFLPSTSAGSAAESPTAPAGDQPMVQAASQEESKQAPHQVQLRYWRERRAAAVRAGVDSDVQACDEHIRTLQQAAQAAKPWEVRVKAATDAQRAAATKMAAVESDLAMARQMVVHFEAEARTAKEALTEADAALAKVQAEGAPRQPAARELALTEQGIAEALAVLAAAGAEIQRGAGGGAGAGGSASGGVSELVQQLRGAVEAAMAGAAVEARAGVAVGAAGGLGASAPVAVAAREPAIAAAEPCASVALAPVAEGDHGHARPLSLAEANAAVPNAPAATGQQATLKDMFKRSAAAFAEGSAGKGSSKGGARESPY